MIRAATAMLCAASAALAGCDDRAAFIGGAEANTRAVAGAPAHTKPSRTVICQDDPALPDDAVITALGTPAQETRFTMAQPVTEFRIRLLNHFQRPRDAGTVIREQTWRDGDCRLTIWSARQGGGWRPVDRLGWSAGDAF